MMAVSSNIENPDSTEALIVWPEGNEIDPEYRQSELYFEGEFEPELMDVFNDYYDDNYTVETESLADEAYTEKNELHLCRLQAAHVAFFALQLHLRALRRT
uniref:Antirestriction protein n=1 Tax=Panagrellus redivivus TaxID=6233 RepID=A0A7E4WE55_PANRE